MNGGEQLKRYGIAVLAVLLAFAARAVLMPAIGTERFPFALFLIAIVFCALYCGVGPSILAAFSSVLAVWFVFLPPHLSFALNQPGLQLQQVAVFLILSGSFIAVGESNRRTRLSLEARVRERTRELLEASEGLRELSARLLQTQDEERRRVARDLHDGVGQLLAAISMNVALIAQEKENLTPAGQQRAGENLSMIQEAIAEIRTMSYLLHPPLLDEIGLKCALQGYVDGFVERSKVSVTLELPQNLERLPIEKELCLFRVAQECLTNIHRHAGSATAAIRLEEGSGRIAMEVSDYGRGISPELRAKLLSGQGSGVGLRGMRERIRKLGGTLEIGSNGRGTSVRVVVPVPEKPGVAERPAGTEQPAIAMGLSPALEEE